VDALLNENRKPISDGLRVSGSRSTARERLLGSRPWGRGLRGRGAARPRARGSQRSAVPACGLPADRGVVVNHLGPSLQYPAFDSLMGGAFNQDWRDEWPSVDHVLAEALDDFPATRNALLPELLEIRANCTEADVVDRLSSMGSGFRPEVDANVSALGWVDSLIRRISGPDAADA